MTWTPRSPTAAVTGQVGLSAPIAELAKLTWDAIIVGAGHNGLTCASYLARAGKRVLVLESRERVGGANTLEERWPGVRISPCAYVVGLLHPLVMQELNLKEHGFEWTPASGGMFVPFEDGSSVQLWCDDDKCENEIQRFAPEDHAGWLAMRELKRRLRDLIRPEGERDLWIGPAPTREELESRIGNDRDLKGLLFEWSMVEYVDKYLTNEKLKMAYLGQGVIGTNASPFDPGTAYINFHHASGRMDGLAGTWGYVKGGMGMVSFLLCDIAKERGVTVATGVPVSRIIPEEGVQLESGERIYSKVVVSNADPRVALRLLGPHADGKWKAEVESVPMTGCTVKVNMTLRELPNFTARPGILEPHHYGQVNTPLTKTEWKESFASMRRRELPHRLWTELYFHSAFDQSVVPKNVHTMSVFAQYVPYQFAHGNWDSRREEVKERVIGTLARYCSNMPEAIIDMEVMGPPDIESKVGLTGGHIFQGECLPQFMWENRLKAKTPMPGVYLCGAATHPGGSVIGINGRNAAMEILGLNRRSRSAS